MTTPDQRKAEVVRYEIKILRELTDAWFAGTVETLPRCLYRAFVESRYIHIRCLIDFFYGLGSRDDDINAVDFLGEGATQEWETKHKGTMGLKDDAPLFKVREHCHKMLAHMSESRWVEVHGEDAQESTWQKKPPPAELRIVLERLRELWQEFVGLAPAGFGFDAAALDGPL